MPLLQYGTSAYPQQSIGFGRATLELRLGTASFGARASARLKPASGQALRSAEARLARTCHGSQFNNGAALVLLDSSELDGSSRRRPGPVTAGPGGDSASAN